MACLAVYMQQIFEQYGIPFAGSREPAQAINTIFPGIFPSDGLRISPSVGPDADANRSNCKPVITSLYLPYPYSGNPEGCITLKPVAITTAPTSSSTSSSSWSKRIAPVGQTFSQTLHFPF